MCTEDLGGSSPPTGHLGTRGTSSEGGLRSEQAASVLLQNHRTQKGHQEIGPLFSATQRERRAGL